MLSIRELLLLAATLAVGFSFELSFSSIYCPPDELVQPCTCDQNSDTKAVEVFCRKITRPIDLIQVFKGIPEWSFTVLNLVDSVIPFIPAVTSESSEYSVLNIERSTLSILYDLPPPAYKLKSVYIRNSKILRGMVWNQFSKTSLEKLVVEHTPVPVITDLFGKELTKSVTFISFVDTHTTGVGLTAFADLKNVKSLTISSVNLRILKRSMFSRPGNYEYLDFSNNKITTLPDDLFEDMPSLALVNLKNNEIATTWEAVFSKQSAAYWLDGNPLICNCYTKWLALEENRKRFTFSGECSGPSNVKGKQLSRLTDDHFRYCK